jgi:hypothetical protein
MSVAEMQPAAPKVNRRWFQFSLRSLLLLTAVLALWLGYITGNARQQQKAVETLTAMQAEVFYDYDLAAPDDEVFAFSMGAAGKIVTGRYWTRYTDGEPHGPKWLRECVGEDYFRSVVAVYFETYQAPQITGEDLRQISALSYLKRLTLDNAQSLSDEDFEHLNRLRRLERLYLAETQITDLGMHHLSNLTNLQYLSLAKTRITDAGLVCLQGMTHLEMLELSDTGISDAGLKYLRGLTNLKTVYLDGTKVTKKGAEELQAALPNCAVLLCAPGVFG